MWRDVDSPVKRGCPLPSYRDPMTVNEASSPKSPTKTGSRGFLAFVLVALVIAVAIAVVYLPTGSLNMSAPTGSFDARFVLGVAGLVGAALGAIPCIADFSKSVFEGELRPRMALDLLGLLATGVSLGILAEYLIAVAAVAV